MANTGDLTEKVLLRRPAGGFDALGQPLVGYEPGVRVWADVRYLPGLSVIKAGAEVSVLRASVRIRRRPVDATFQVVHDGRVLEIEAVQPEKTRTFVDLVCKGVA